jgi:hypothetical protein
LTLTTAIVIGLAPSLRRATLDAYTVLRQSGSTATADRRTSRIRRALVAVQVSLVLLVMIASGLLWRTFWNLQRVDLGFDPSNVLTLELRTMGESAIRARRDELLARIRAVPGVVDVGIANPLGAVPMQPRDVRQNATTRTARHNSSVFLKTVDAGYFRALRIPLKSGRTFDGANESSALLSEGAATLLFPNEDPIGQAITVAVWPLTVRGVVGDVRYRRVDEAPAPVVYRMTQPSAPNATFVIRMVPGGSAVPAAVRSIVRDVDPSQPIEHMAMLDARVSNSLPNVASMLFRRRLFL